MFKNILLATDGSPLSRSAARQAVALAKATGAKITGLHIAPAYKLHLYADYLPSDFLLPGAYKAKVQQVAQRHLDAVKKLATAAGVKFTGHYEMSDLIADAIVAAARKYRCDSIVMGSHGRKGVSRLFLGSETQKVLVKARIPVVVTR